MRVMRAGPALPWIAPRVTLVRLCDLFFFQAEDGIRDRDVTGVQTCALPIYAERRMRVDPLRHPRSEFPLPGSGILSGSRSPWLEIQLSSYAPHLTRRVEVRPK